MDRVTVYRVVPSAIGPERWERAMPTNDYAVTGGLRVECANLTNLTYRWTYRVVEYGPDRRLEWWLTKDDPAAVYVADPPRVRFARVGNMGGTPVTAAEAELVLGWPASGWESPENPCFDALRELVHAAS